MDKILPKGQGKHDILIVVLIAAPLMVAGFVWAMISGGYTESDEPSNVISIPAPSPAASPAFLVTPES